MNTRHDRRSFLKAASLMAAGSIGTASLPRPATAVPPLDRPERSNLKISLAGYSFRKYLQAKSEEEKMSLIQFVEYCAEMGLDGTEPTGYYFPPNPTDEYLVELKRRAFVLGLDVSGTAIANNFALPPGDERNRQIAHVKTWIDIADKIGAPTIRIFSGNVPQGHTLEEAQDWFAECVEEACAYSGTKGIFLALENHGGISVPVESMLTILEKVKSPWFSINLDTGNFHSDDPYADMARVAPYATNVQVKVVVSPRGKGAQEADYERIVGILREAGYSGYVVLEYEASEEPKVRVPKELERLRKALEA